MTATAIKKNLHKYIDAISDSAYLQAIHELLYIKASEETDELSDVEKKLLLKRIVEHKRNVGKLYTWSEAKEKILNGKK